MERLVEVVQRRARERAQRFVGRTLEVLVEGPSRTDPTRLPGPHAPQQGRQLRGHRAGRASWSRSRSWPRPRRPSAATSACAAARARKAAPMRVLAIFGPTAAARPRVAIEVAELLRGRGEDPVAVNCDSIQVYRGLETLSGAAGPGERARLEHRLLAFVPVDRGVLRRAVRGARARRDRPAAGRGAPPDRRRRHRPLPAGRARRARAAPAGRARDPRGGRARDRRARSRCAARRARPRSSPPARTRTTASASPG